MKSRGKEEANMPNPWTEDGNARTEGGNPRTEGGTPGRRMGMPGRRMGVLASEAQGFASGKESIACFTMRTLSLGDK